MQVVEAVSHMARYMQPSSSVNHPRFARQTGGALMPYRFGYAVQDDVGNDFNQQEQSDGNVVSPINASLFQSNNSGIELTLENF